MGELLSSMGLYPFMFRGQISDFNLATSSGYYYFQGNVLNSPFADGRGWGVLEVIAEQIYPVRKVYSYTDKKAYISIGDDDSWHSISEQ